MLTFHELEQAATKASRLADDLEGLVLAADAALQGVLSTQVTRVRAAARALMRESLQLRMLTVQQRLNDLTAEQNNLQTQITQL